MVFSIMYRVEQRLLGDQREDAWVEQVETDVFDLALDVYDTVREISDMDKEFEFRLIQRIEFTIKIQLVGADTYSTSKTWVENVLSTK